MPLGQIGAALISTALNTGSSAIQSGGSRKSQKRANKYNVSQWKRQNRYNNPAAQMDRLKAAGLNPNLIYGTSPTSAVGNADSVAPGKAAPYKFDNPIGDITKFADVGNTEQQTDNLKVQNDVLTQEAILKAAQTGELGAKTARTKFDLALSSELRDTSLSAAKENLRQMEVSTVGKQLDNTFKSQSLKNRVKAINYNVQQAKSDLKGQELLNALREEELELKKLGIERGDNMFFRIMGKTVDGIRKRAQSGKYKNKLFKN